MYPGEPAPGENGLIAILPGRHMQDHDNTAGYLSHEPPENKPAKRFFSVRVENKPFNCRSRQNTPKLSPI
jgi:hypothetical protein